VTVKRAVLGVDSSTQATKVLLVDVADGTVLGAGRAPHAVTGTDGARESDPEEWWTALVTATRQAIASAGSAVSGGSAGSAAEIGAAGSRGRVEVVGIAVGGQQHGLVTLDGGGRPVRPAMLWNDTRSAADAEALTGALGGPEAWAASTGTVPVASVTATKWSWLRRNEPGAAKATAAIRLPHDFLTERLSGAAVTDRGDASGSGWWSTATGSYDRKILGLPALELDAALLPEVLGPTASAGPVRAAVLDELGLSGEVLVGPGTGDNMAAALGLGAPAGQPVMSLGTSGTVYAVTAARPADPSGIVAGFADAAGGFLPLACTLNCTLAVDRIAALLGLDREAVEPGGEVVLLPYLDGERTPNLPAAAGTLTGLRHDTTPGQLLRAAYEGAAYSLLAALDGIGTATGEPLAGGEPILLIGGGAKGGAWRDTIRRLSGRPLVVPEQQELVAFGAAVQAAAVATGDDPVAVARRWHTQRGTSHEALPRDDAARDRLATALAHLTAGTL
jgi:xylulokinase